ncbi:MAG TPA: hypothetical protein VH143_04745, partial [Kofleriaceae bacterium]|nr:hypothetical protein [Kofleriaceae bacterium]
MLQAVALIDLKENSTAHEVQFVANASDTSFTSVARLYLASVLAAQTKLRADTLFALFGQGIPATLDASLASLPSTGLDAAFAKQVLASVLSYSRSALAATLTAAVAADVVPASYEQAQSAQLDLIDSLRAASVSTASFGQGATSLADVLAAGSVSSAATAAFTAAYAANGGAVDAALQAVQSNATVSAADLTTLTNTVELGSLLSGNAPLVKDAMQRIAAKTLATVSDLALLSASDWTTRITAVDPQATSIAATTAGETAAQKIAQFSTQLASQLAATYPTTAFRGGLASAKQSAFATKTELVSVLAANPTLDLLHVVIDQYVAINKLTISAAALADLKAAQRLMRLAPSYSSIEALKAAGFQSAQGIYLSGRAAFLAKVTTALGGAAAAQLVYARAQMTYATALTTWAQFSSAFNRVSFDALPATTMSSLSSQIADIQTLFGDQSYFECEDCQSVLSPAAYLVDLLQYLANFSATLLAAPPAPSGFPPASPPQPWTAREALLYRRPEIQYIALDCTNTNVTIPYIDLVNEILEAFITNATPPAIIETTGTAAERRALPQSISQTAYQATQEAVFPLTLPFDLSFAQTSEYLAAMGVSRRE